MINPLDIVSIQRISNMSERTFVKIEPFISELVKSENIEDIINKIPGIARGTKNKIFALFSLRNEMIPYIAEEKISNIVKDVLKKSGYLEKLKEDETYEARRENIDEFLRACSEFEKKEEGDLPLFLEEISLYTDLDISSPDEDVTPIMTFHSSKGLEFKVIFIVGAEEGLLPHNRSLDSLSDIEEERRLFYVGMTRARELLYITYASRRNLYGNTLFTQKSRFLAEIPKECIEKINNKKDILFTVPMKKHVNYEDKDFREGDEVVHNKWGEGTVMRKIAIGGKELLEIDFKENGVKRLILGYAPIFKIRG